MNIDDLDKELKVPSQPFIELIMTLEKNLGESFFMYSILEDKKGIKIIPKAKAFTKIINNAAKSIGLIMNDEGEIRIK